MAAGTFNFTIEQGVTLSLSMTYLAGSPQVAVDLTGWSAQLQIRESSHATAVLVEFSTTDLSITLGGVDGTILIEAPDTETALYDWDAARYDLKLISPSGIVKRLLRGTVNLSREVTHD